MSKNWEQTLKSCIQTEELVFFLLKSRFYFLLDFNLNISATQIVDLFWYIVPQDHLGIRTASFTALWKYKNVCNSFPCPVFSIVKGQRLCPLWVGKVKSVWSSVGHALPSTSRSLLLPNQSSRLTFGPFWKKMKCDHRKWLLVHNIRIFKETWHYFVCLGATETWSHLLSSF